MAYKVNPLSFRLGISRVCRTTNNVYLSNYSFLWAEYFKYEKFLFLFFYKYKFWVVSTKMLFLTYSSMLIFCNYYRLRPYFNRRPRRKKKRAFYDPDGQPRTFHFIKYFDRIFFKKPLFKFVKEKHFKFFLYKNIQSFHCNSKTSKFAGRFIRYIRRWLKSLKRRKFGIMRSIDGKFTRYKSIKRDFVYMQTLKTKRKFKSLNKIIKKFRITNIKFIKLVRQVRRKFTFGLMYLLKRKKYNIFRYSLKNFPYNIKFKQNNNNSIVVNKFANIHKNLPHYYNIEYLKKTHRKFNNNKYLKAYNIEEDSYKFGLVFKNTLISDKVFFFHLKRLLKCIFFKKNINLKLRNIENLVPYKMFIWEDALRTAFLIQYKKKHFVRTIFKDFSYLNKIAYLEMDAQLFAKIIINMFEMTKFHTRLIYLLKSVFKTLSMYYRYIDCKVKIKGKMQYKRRTKTVYIFKKTVIPLNILDIRVEYGKGPANTPFGVIGIKTWLYYKNYFRYSDKSTILLDSTKMQEDIHYKQTYLFKKSNLISDIKKSNLKILSKSIRESIRWKRYCKELNRKKRIKQPYYRIPKVSDPRLNTAVRNYISNPINKSTLVNNNIGKLGSII